MSYSFGRSLRVQIFGQSHGEMIGCVIDGLPAGIKLDTDEISAFMARRAPGRDANSTSRKESDVPRIVSGLFDGYTCGAPLTAIIENSDHRSSDYGKLKDTPRPNHADFPARIKYGGFADYRGGGSFSGRLTAPLCFAGAAAIQYLRMCGVDIGAHIYRIGGVTDTPFDPLGVKSETLKYISSKPFPVISVEAEEKMKAVIGKARSDLDSVGGLVECSAVGVPAGIGEPRYDGIESAIASICFGIPAVKGVEFGLGFGFGSSFGSDANDQMRVSGGDVVFDSNNCGGVTGGISDGRPIIFRCAFKPTPSIARPQTTADLNEMKTTTLEISGRHDPCVVHRAVPAVESAAALAIADLMLAVNGNRHV
ncbi:MAG: chorismate synthase [Clostridia bacterium]|nr:chorismate synthase [Clostridia bacterium]